MTTIQFDAENSSITIDHTRVSFFLDYTPNETYFSDIEDFFSGTTNARDLLRTHGIRVQLLRTNNETIWFDYKMTHVDYDCSVHVPITHPNLFHQNLVSFLRELARQEEDDIMDDPDVADFVSSHQPKPTKETVPGLVDILISHQDTKTNKETVPDLADMVSRRPDEKKRVGNLTTFFESLHRTKDPAHPSLEDIANNVLKL